MGWHNDVTVTPGLAAADIFIVHNKYGSYLAEWHEFLFEFFFVNVYRKIAYINVHLLFITLRPRKLF